MIFEKSKRQFIVFSTKIIGSIGLTSFLGWKLFKTESKTMNSHKTSIIVEKLPLGFQWPTFEPFLFCVHHLDQYPKGNGQFGPTDFSWSGRNPGSDFEPKDGYRMYHGEEVPGFPVHPHRGFETVTIVRKGYVDHADSMGAAGRYGEGDVQWMTAGRGVQHCEMFPLLHTDKQNTAELFQIWLNLPAKSKMAEPHFSMFWSEKIPQLSLDSGKVQMSLIFGQYDEQKSLPAPPDSWASQTESETQIYLLKMESGSHWKMPASQNKAHRALYVFAGQKLSINGEIVVAHHCYRVDSEKELEILAIDQTLEILVLQSRPIGEPVFQHGPFVMNTREEIVKTIQDYQRTQFGGWPWPRPDTVHGPKIERFAKFPDGRLEKPKA